MPEPPKKTGTEIRLADKDAFYQEIRVSEIQGRYFLLGSNRFILQKDYPDYDERSAWREKNPESVGDNPFDIYPDPHYGWPSVPAYRIWVACEKIASDMGPGFDGVVILGAREIARLIGRKWDGVKTSREINRAIRQLRETKIQVWAFDKDDNLVDTDFELISRLTRTRQTKRGQVSQYYLEIYPSLLKSLYQNRYFYCMSWQRLDGLSPQAHRLARIIYRYLSYRYSKTNNSGFRLVKDYHKFCVQWLGGATPQKTRSEILKNQLNKPLLEIKKHGIISKYDVERNAAKDGFNVLLYPGDGFFDDFARFYQTQIPLDFGEKKALKERTKEIPISDTLALLRKFYADCLGIENHDDDYLEKEIAYAKKLLAKYSPEEVNLFIKFGIGKSLNNNFKMQTFNGLKIYEKDYLLYREKETARLAREAAEAEKNREMQLEAAYGKFREKELKKVRAELDAAALKSLCQEVTKQLEIQLPGQRLMKAHIQSRENTILAEEHKIPSFEKWKKDKK